MNRWLLGVLGAVVLIGLLLLLFRPAAEPDFVEAEEDAAPGMAAAPEAAPWPADPVPLPPPPQLPRQPQAPAPQGAPGAAPQPPLQPEATPPAPAPKMPDIPPPTRGGEIDRLKRAYEDDSADSEAPATEARIRELFTQEGMPTDALQSVTCHRRVCRVRMTWSKAQPLSFMAAYMALGMHVSKTVGVEPQAEVDEHGVMPFDLYVLRGGIAESDF